jgi:hypothetical protein
VLDGDRLVGGAEIERNPIVEVDHMERSERLGFGPAEHFCQEPRRRFLVFAENDGVVELHAHGTARMPPRQPLGTGRVDALSLSLCRETSNDHKLAKGAFSDTKTLMATA